MKIPIKYGKTHLDIPLPEHTPVIVPKEPEMQVTPEHFRENLDQFLEDKMANPVSIVVSDKTRLCSYPDYLPILTQALLDHGYTREQITFYIAYGTHARQTEEESLRAYGSTYQNFRFVHHDGKDESAVVNLGTTTRGTQVKIRREIIESGLIITMGAISHHYFAGFGGGRKLLFPGLAATPSIYENHCLFIDFPNQQLQPGCQSGNLDDNPVALDLEEMNRLFPQRLEIHGILNPYGEAVAFHFGRSYEDFRKACEHYDRYYRITKSEYYDLVIAGCGGYPKDINFIQSHKSMHNAASFVKDGGTLILLAECIDGMGNDAFLGLFDKSQPELVDALEKHYSGNGGTALSTMSKTSRINILMHTSLSKETCRKLGMQKTNEEEIRKTISEPQRMAVIPVAAMVY